MTTVIKFALLLLFLSFSLADFGLFETNFVDLSTTDPSKHYLVLANLSLHGARFSERPAQKLFEGDPKSFGLEFVPDRPRAELSFTYSINNLPINSSIVFYQEELPHYTIRNLTSTSQGLSSIVGMMLESYYYGVTFFFQPLEINFSELFEDSVSSALVTKSVVFKFSFFGEAEQQRISVKGIPSSLFPKNINGLAEVNYETTEPLQFQLTYQDANSVNHYPFFSFSAGWIRGSSQGGRNEGFSMSIYESDNHFVDVHFYL
ncbi:hypothetical protein RCL1_000883 [Eukaryota sp. TZLM3-RCL]